jgi:hypothetical protein
MDTVTVACKLPHGMHLEVRNPAGIVEQRVTIKGARLKTSASGREITAGHETTGDFGQAYGLTPDVPADFWARWARENAAYPPYAKGYIFAQSDIGDARAQARELAELQTGFEPLSPDKAKLPRGIEPFDPKS